jgi:integration host factor subunit alpha
MTKTKISNLTKLDISKKINSKIGFSLVYVNEITEDFILILKNLIKKNEIVIKNFGTFRSIYKKERVGRNPKTKKQYKIISQNSLSFSISKNFNKKINNL